MLSVTLRLFLTLAFGLVEIAAVRAGPDRGEDTADYLPGLNAELTAGGKTYRRLDEVIAFDWAGGSPDARIAAGTFSARWTGRLFVRRGDTYRFSTQIAGRFKLWINDTIVLDGEAGKVGDTGWLISSPTQLRFGYHPLSIEFTQTSGVARLGLFWEGKQFQRERVPAWALVHAPTAIAFDLAQRGEALVRAHRCTACHALPLAGTPLRSPSLRLLKDAVSPHWLTDYLQHPTAHKQGIRMPDFGLSAEGAQAVAAFLWSNSSAAPVGIPAPGNAANGKKLAERLGCLACHRIDGRGKDALFGGGDLSQIAKKRPAGFFARWLQYPESFNPQHRMPIFPLDQTEVADLSAYLARLGADTRAGALLPWTLRGDVTQGREIVIAKRCANCHEIPGLKAAGSLAWPNKSGFDKGAAGCLGDPDSAHDRPGYRFTAPDQHAVMAFLSELPAKASARLSQTLAGLSLLADNNCLSCHARGNSAGLREVVAQLGMLEPKLQAALVPPALHTVGDKLQAEWLARAVAGKAPRLRPWLAPRMPRFPLSVKEVEALSSALVASDLVPDSLPAKHTIANDKELLQAAPQLLGAKGLGCTSCHAVGPYLASEGEPGTRGPDLRFPDQRMRQSWFLRFIRDPARLDPGVEMPAVLQAAPGILGTDAQAQREALWHGLNSPQLRLQINDTVQVLIARPGEPALILRDLFEPGPKMATVRPFAIGLPNGHNLLLDLETMSLRRWWIGDFARQKVRGKKWYWETAGITLLDQPNPAPLLTLKPPPMGNGQTVGWLEWYEHTNDGVRLRFRLHEDHVPVELTIVPLKDGWLVRLEVPSFKWRMARITSNGESAFQTPAGPASVASTIIDLKANSWTAEYRFTTSAKPRQEKSTPPVAVSRKARVLPAMAGYEVIRLPLDEGPMPTALAWRQDGTLVVSSLKGGIFLAEDSDGDGLPDRYRRFGDYLSAPFGLLTDGDDVLVSHRHEVLRLKERKHSGHADRSEVLATGWGVSSDYHDWTVGPVRDKAGRLYVVLSCQEDDRSPAAALGRGKVLQIAPDGRFKEYAAGQRYAMGLVANPRGDLFATDNQGVTNPFNELNHLRPGRHYGFFNKHESTAGAPLVTLPAIQIPHPWTRSVNGIAFIPSDGRFGPFGGQLIGADYTTRKLIRLSLQRIGDTYQGAAYPFSREDIDLIARDETFLGPLAVAFGPDGCLYVGSMIDSGWGGGNNRGAIERVRHVGPVPFGIREVRAHAQGFTIDFTGPVDARMAASVDPYTLSCYRRIHHGGYETPDQDRTRVTVERVEVSGDRRSVKLFVRPLRPTFVYEIAVGSVQDSNQPPFPAAAYYTLNEVPKEP